MDRQTLTTELKKIIAEFLTQQNLDLVDLTYRYEGRDLILKVLVDKPGGGITLDECAALNNKIGELLDAEGLPQEKFILEVSSPGLSRLLKTKADFLRCLKKKAKFFFFPAVNGKIELEGVISRVENDTVYIDTQDKVLEVPLGKINWARQIY